MLAKQIINLDLQLIVAKAKQLLTHPPALNQIALHQPAPHQPETNLAAPQPLKSNDMSGILTERTRQILNLYWQPGQLIGALVSQFRQIQYLPISNAMPDIDQMLSEAIVNCARDLNKQLIEFGGAAKVWMTLLI